MNAYKASSQSAAPDPISWLKQYRETGCNEAATSLLLHYEPLVRVAAGKMSRSRPDLYEDMFQVGRMALLRLFKQYDEATGIPFEGYAMKSVIGNLKNFLRDKSWYIQVPRKVKEKGAALQNAIDTLTVELERSPRVEEIAERLELTEEETIELLAGRDYYNYTSLDTPIAQEDDSATIGDFIANPASEYEELVNRLDLQEAIGQLKEEERMVLQLVYAEGKSQRTIAEQLGVSQMSVSRIQKRAIDKLKKIL